jgi:hypothetical protein
VLPTCSDFVIVDLYLRGDYTATLGPAPAGAAVEAWALYSLPAMLPSLGYNAKEVIARFTGNGVMIIVGVECPEGVCPESFIAADADCRRGNQTLGEARFVCEGGPSLPADAVLPEGTTAALIQNTYIETESLPAGYDAEVAAMCDDMYADFAETGMLMCLMDEDGASERQNTQLFGLSAAFGGGGRGRRRLQGFGGGGAVTCSETCLSAIQPLLDKCLDYVPIAQEFAEPCLPENVIPGGFDASCLNGVDHLIMTCGIASIEDMSNGCSAECGAWAGPWWAMCREHLAPVIDAEVPGSSLMLEGFIAYCPTPCADVSLTQVHETVITAPISEDTLRDIVAGSIGLADAASVDIRELKHIALFSVSVPGQASDYAGDSDSGAAEAIIDGVASATGVDPVDIAVLSATATAYDLVPAPPPPPGGGGRGGWPQRVDTQVSVEMIIQGSGAENNVEAAIQPLLSGEAAAPIADRIGAPAATVAIARPPVTETEASYALPDGVDPPADLDLMTRLIADYSVFGVVQTAPRMVPEVVLRNDGTVCGTDGAVCTDDPSADGIGDNAPMITISPTCPDLTGDSSVGVDDLLALLAGFGRQC